MTDKQAIAVELIKLRSLITYATIPMIVAEGYENMEVKRQEAARINMVLDELTDCMRDMDKIRVDIERKERQ